MKNINKLLGAFLCAGSLSASLVHADETFTQDGKQYVLKSGVVGVIHKPANKFRLNQKQPPSASGSQKQNTFFDVYDESKLRVQSNKESSKKYRVVYRQVTDPETQEVTEVPALLTGSVIVQTNQASALKTSLKLKKSFQTDGFYLYELPADKSVAQVLSELSTEPGVKARVEVIEHLNVPM